jgi:hypothetical protein
MPVIHVYSRPGCHLCDVLVEELLPLLHGRIDLEIRNIDSNDAWRFEYDIRIPVVEYEGRVICEYELDKARIEELVAAVA